MNPLERIANIAGRPAEAISKAMNRPIAPSPQSVMGLLRRGHPLREVVKDRMVLVTGASSGIGEAAALQIGNAGGNVILVARGAEKLADTARAVEAAGGTAHVHPTDLSSYDAIDALVADVIAEHGGVDILVNNAGRSIRRSLTLSYDRFHDFERTMQLNYFAPMRLILGLIPGMRERKFGHIVNVSSVGVQTRVPRFAAYIASKAALDTASDAFQAETRDDNVAFTTIFMPLVRTPMIAPTKIYDRFPALTPEEAGEVVCEAIANRPRRISPAFGRMASVADGLSPQLMDVVRNRGFKMFKDSSAAKGGKAGTPEDEQVTAAGRAFAEVTRGVHW
jgi:short-subunit dehydrogenase